MNQCRACGNDFSSVALFDRHRVGKHAYTYQEGLKFDPPVEDGRRCLSVEEMEHKGWLVNDRRRWFDPAETLRTREAFDTKRTAASEDEDGVPAGQMTLPGTDNPTEISP